MTPSQAISHLKRAGLTEVVIASRVGARQSTINRIASGRIKRPNWQVANALIRLASEPDIVGPAPTEGEADRAA